MLHTSNWQFYLLFSAFFISGIHKVPGFNLVGRSRDHADPAIRAIACDSHSIAMYINKMAIEFQMIN